MAEPDIILCGIIAEEMDLDSGRVVVYDQNFIAPKDNDIFVVVVLQSTRIIGGSNKLDEDTDEEVKSVAMSQIYNVEVTSRNRDAQTRHMEVIAAITSTYSQQQQESNQIKIMRGGQILDLSFIDGSSSLHRYRIPVIINSVKTYRKEIVPYEHFPTTEEEFE